MGNTKREAVLTLYLVQSALGVAALVVMQADLLVGYVTGAAVLVCGIVAAYKLEQIDLTDTNPGPANAPPAVPLRQRLARSGKRDA